MLRKSLFSFASSVIACSHLSATNLNASDLNLSLPGLVGTVSTQGSGPFDIEIQGTTAYVSNQGSNSLAIYDVKQPLQALFKGTAQAGGSPRLMSSNGTTLYVSNWAGPSIGIYDISQPGSAVFKGTISCGGSSPNNIKILGTTGYVALTSALGLFDASTPASATFIATVTSGGSGDTLFKTNYLEIVGTTAFISNSFSGDVGVIDISIPGSATFKGSVTSGGNIPGVFVVSGTTLFINNWNSGNLGIIDVSVPGSATFKGTVASGGLYPINMILNGSYIYAANESNLGIIDTATPGSATLVGTMLTPGVKARDLALSYPYGYASSSDSNNIGYFDITLPGSPQYLGTFSSGGSSPFTLAIHGTTGFVTLLNSDALGIFSAPVYTDVIFTPLGTTVGEWSVGSSWLGSYAPLSGSPVEFPEVITGGTFWQARLFTNPGSASHLTINGTTLIFGRESLNLTPSDLNVLVINKPLTLRGTSGLLRTNIAQPGGTITVNSDFTLDEAAWVTVNTSSSSAIDITGGGLIKLIQLGSRLISTEASGPHVLNINSVEIDNSGYMGIFGGTYSSHVNISLSSGSITNNFVFADFSGSASGTCTIDSGTITNNQGFANSLESSSLDVIMNSGYIQNKGFLAAYNSRGGRVIFNGGEFLNRDNFARFAGSSIGTITISGGLITNQDLEVRAAHIGEGAKSFTINGTAKIINSGQYDGAYIAENVSNLSIAGSCIVQNLNASSTIGLFDAMNAEVTFSGGSIQNLGSLIQFENGAQGQFTMTGGDLVNQNFCASFNGTSTGTVMVLGGSILNQDTSTTPAQFGFSADSFSIGGSAYLVNRGQFGGAIIADNVSNLSIAGSCIVQNINGSSLLGVFNSKNSQVTISGGSIENSGILCVYNDSSLGTVSITGGQIKNDSDAVFCQIDSSHIKASLSSASITNKSDFLRYRGTSSGLVEIQSGTLNNSSNFIYADSSSLVDVVFSGGQLFNRSSMDFYSASFAGGVNKIDINGSAVIFNEGNTTSAHVGENISKLSISGSCQINNLNGSSYLGVVNSKNGSISISGGSIYNAGQIVLFLDESSGSVSISNGRFFNTDLGVLIAYTGSSTGSITLSGGSIVNSAYVGNFLNNSLIDLNVQGGLIDNRSSCYRFSDSSFGRVIQTDGQVINGTLGNYLFFEGSSTGSITLSGGSFTNHGQLASFDQNAQGSLRILGGTIVNTARFAVFDGSSTGSITFLGGFLSNSGQAPSYAATFGENTDMLAIKGSALIVNRAPDVFSFIGYGAKEIFLDESCRIINQGGGTFSYIGPIAESMVITGSAFIHNINGSSVVGPSPLDMTGGVIINDGVIALDKLQELSPTSYERLPSESHLLGGSITGSGKLLVAGTTTFATSITQSHVMVGYGYEFLSDQPEPALGALFANSVINAPVKVSGSGALYGSGTISGSLSCFGQMAPGITAVSRGDLFVTSDVALLGDEAQFGVNIDGLICNKLVSNGTFSLLNGSSALVITKTLSPISSGFEYRIAEAPLIVGTFTYLVKDPAIPEEFSVVYNRDSSPNTISLFASAPVQFLSFDGNGGVIARMLNRINGSCPQSTQNFINYLRTLPPSLQKQGCNEAAPAFKVIQYSLEKLDLLIHKELEDELYESKNATHLFVKGGYDNLDQGTKGPYNGYSVDTYYQLLGVTHKGKSMNFLMSAGASESYIKARPQKACGSYDTVWGSLGLAGRLNRFQLGVDALFGYSFISAKRTISLVSLNAKTNHGAWNASLDGKVAFELKNRVAECFIYDDVSYIYGQENSYTEKNAPGLNLHVKDEKISQVRNMLGITLESKHSRTFKVFADASWVYEHCLNNNDFYGAFEGTDVYGTFKQTRPCENYARIHSGFKGEYKDFSWQLAYTGLFAKRFSENSASLKIGLKL